MSENFHLLRLHDSSLTPVHNARCTLAISPMTSSTAYVNRGNDGLSGTGSSTFQIVEVDVPSYYCVAVRPSTHIVL
jgi:hypothetical protein